MFFTHWCRQGGNPVVAVDHDTDSGSQSHHWADSPEQAASASTPVTLQKHSRCVETKSRGFMLKTRSDSTIEQEMADLTLLRWYHAGISASDDRASIGQESPLRSREQRDNGSRHDVEHTKRGFLRVQMRLARNHTYCLQYTLVWRTAAYLRYVVQRWTMDDAGEFRATDRRWAVGVLRRFHARSCRAFNRTAPYQASRRLLTISSELSGMISW
jgi:hypothetical protein